MSDSEVKEILDTLPLGPVTLIILARTSEASGKDGNNGIFFLDMYVNIFPMDTSTTRSTVH